MTTFLNTLTPEQRAELRQKAVLSKEAKREANKHIRTDYADMQHWEELASKHGVRLPIRYYPSTDIKYVVRIAKKLGVDVKEYVSTTGCKSLKELAELNRGWSAAAMCGLFLEYAEEEMGK